MTSVAKLGLTPVELGELLHAYVDTIPESVIRVSSAREDLVGTWGGLPPLGVVAGMVFAMLTRASYSARLSWFQPLGWQRVSRMLCHLRPTPPENKSPGDTVPGFEKVIDPVAIGAQYGMMPVQPDDKSRFWGANSFAQLPAFGGKVRRGVAQRPGYRAPEVSQFEKGTDSGPRSIETDPGADLTGPGAWGCLKLTVKQVPQLHK